MPILFETVTPLSKRMERQTTPSIAGQTPQIAFSSKGKVPNRNKNNSSIKPNKFHSKYVCSGGRKTPEVLVTRYAATATRKVVSSSTLIGPFEFKNCVRMALKSAQADKLATHLR